MRLRRTRGRIAQEERRGQEYEGEKKTRRDSPGNSTDRIAHLIQMERRSKEQEMKTVVECRKRRGSRKKRQRGIERDGDDGIYRHDQIVGGLRRKRERE